MCQHLGVCFSQIGVGFAGVWSKISVAETTSLFFSLPHFPLGIGWALLLMFYLLRRSIVSQLLKLEKGHVATYPLALEVPASHGTHHLCISPATEVTCTGICPISHGSPGTGKTWRMAPTIGLWERVYRGHAKVPGTQQEPSMCHLPPEKCPCPLESFPPTTFLLKETTMWRWLSLETQKGGLLSILRQMKSSAGHRIGQDLLILVWPEHIWTVAAAKLIFTYTALLMCQALF